jgi:phospholipase/lecithinase/hemolysin
MIGSLSGPARAASPFTQVYVFGDSVSDNGNLHVLTEELAGINFPPSPPYAENNLNGEPWPTYFGEALGVPVHNMAVGGAFSGPIMIPMGGAPVPFSNIYGLIPPLIYGLPGLQEQVAAFLDAHPAGVNPEGLYVLWAGHNDMFVAMAVPALAPSILENIPFNLADAVCQLTAYGARHFLVGNISDASLTPFAQVGNPAEMRAIIQGVINPAIETIFPEAAVACGASSILLADTFGYFNRVYDNPSEYGLTNVTDPCLLSAADPATECGSYMFWDDVHPTTAAMAVFAEFFRNDFCGTTPDHPGLRHKPVQMPPAQWRGVCYGSR